MAARKATMNVEQPAAPEPSARIASALDKLDERISFLLERNERLERRCAEAIAAGRDARQRLSEVSSGELDPAALERRVKELEEENGRLERHAGYLEGRIEKMFSRVRYAVES